VESRQDRIDGRPNVIDRQGEFDVVDRPSDVRREEIERPRGRRRETTHTQVRADRHHWKIGTADEIRQIIREGIEIAVANPILLVDGRQLFVRRLQLLLRRLQLLVCAFEFLVAGQHLLVCGAEVLCHHVVLIDDRLQILFAQG